MAPGGCSGIDPVVAGAAVVNAVAKGPLGDAGVLITRPARQSAALAERIAAIGGRPIVFPAIVILPPDDPESLRAAHANLERYDFAVFVSGNAVEHGAPDPRAWPKHIIAFAPGPGTAEALAAVGIREVRVPNDRQDSEGLLALPELTAPAGKRVLVFRGDGGRDLLGDTLRERGAHVDYVACYRRDKPRSGAQGLKALFAQGAIDAVTITSSEGLDNLWSLADAASRERWSRVPTFVPHERIAQRARELGLDVATTAAGDAGLIAGLLEWFRAHPMERH